MRQKFGTRKEPAEKVVRNIRRATRKQYSAEEKIMIQHCTKSKPMTGSEPTTC